MEHLIQRYGVVAIFLGAGIEGEPFALAGGLLAHRGWMSFAEAALAAIGGSWSVDQFWFHLSRRFRQSAVVRRIAGRPAFARSLELLERRSAPFVLLFRFAYGLRAVAPVAIGASRVSARLFLSLNLISAMTWGLLFTGLGYLLGPAFEAAEARYGTAIGVAGVLLSVTALAVALRRGGERRD